MGKRIEFLDTSFVHQAERDISMIQVGLQSKLTALLNNGHILLGDGAMGTMLQSAGLTDGGAPELWNVDYPDKVESIYLGYAMAGAKIITTNTFGGNSARLKFHDIGDRVFELNHAGARLARKVADSVDALVAGDIGPSGELIEPVGPLSMQEAEEMFAEQAFGLIEGGADFILIETMSHMNEVEAAVRGVQQVTTEMPIVTTLSFDTNYHTMMGVSPKEAVETIANWGVSVIGANCGNGPEEIVPIMTQMAQYRPDNVHLMVQCNAGLPVYEDGKIQYDGSPEVMADYAIKMRNLGIHIIGACCGSTPAHIAAMRAALENIKHDPIPGPPSPAETNESGGSVIESADSRADRAASRRLARRNRRLNDE